MKRLFVGLLLGALLAGAQGCGYGMNRAKDAGEIIDLGLTVSTEPYLSAYVLFPPAMLFPWGAGLVDGYFVGLGGGEPRLFDNYYQESYGFPCVWGVETLSFDMSGEELAGLSEEQLREQATFYRSGLIGIAEGPMTKKDYLFSCPHYLHILFVGAVLSPRYFEALDFVTGFTGIDIAFDDPWTIMGEEKNGAPFWESAPTPAPVPVAAGSLPATPAP